jgi:uncharacterized protein YjiS (DUF1127 family)
MYSFRGPNPRPFSNKNKGMYMFLAKLIRLFRAWRSYERSMHELSRLDDRELADIGITRAEIRAVAWGATRR